MPPMVKQLCRSSKLCHSGPNVPAVRFCSDLIRVVSIGIQARFTFRHSPGTIVELLGEPVQGSPCGNLPGRTELYLADCC